MAVLEQLQAQIARLYGNSFYRDKIKQASLAGGEIKTLEDFQRIPFTTSAEFLAEATKPPTLSAFFGPKVTRVNYSPSGKELYPVCQTNNDLQRMHEVCARTLEAAGVTPDDMVAVTFGYHLFVAGLFYQGQFEHYGAKIIPLGPGESERAVKIINDYGVGVLVSNPTFAMKLAAMGIPSVHTIFVGGEPFTSVEGYAERVKAAFDHDITIIDSYSMASCLPIARSCRHENGLHIMDEFIYAELIDPDSGQPVPLGEKGELVLTHLHKEAAPLLRYRTGDLTVLEEVACHCGRSLTMPKSVIGRTDEMLKVKGVKFWPSQVGTLLRSDPDLAGKNYQVQVESLEGVDTLKLIVQGAEPSDETIQRLSDLLKRETLIKFNQIDFDEQLADGPVLLTKRGGAEQ